MLRTATCLIALAAIVACSGEVPPDEQTPAQAIEQPSDLVQPTEEAERHPLLDVGADETPEAWASLPFARLMLRREGCYGTCPVYEVELRSGGAARYTGRAFAPREGYYEGRVWLYDYALLCAAAQDLGVESMKASYRSAWTDQKTVIVEWQRDGQVHRIEDYGRFAPPAFQAYRALLDEIVSRIQWRRVGEPR